MAESARGTVSIRADPGEVLRAITDFERYPEWQPSVMSTEVIDRAEDGRGVRVRFDLNLTVITATIVLAYTYDDIGLRWHLASGRGVSAVDGGYELTGRGNGTTNVTYFNAVELTISVPRLVLGRARRTLVNEQLHGLKARLESAGRP